MELFPYDSAELRTLCGELDKWRTRLDHRGPLPRAWVGRVRRELEAEAVAASTSMEGVPVTVEEVRRILAGQRPKDVAAPDLELVTGYRDAMNFVLRRADDPAFGWSRELVVGLHDRVLAGRHDLGAGRLRTDRRAFVVNSQTGDQVFIPPGGSEVPGLVDVACSTMAQTHPHPAVASAWIHVAIAAIHPFRDGNGRAARVLAALAMYRGGFKRREFTSLEEWWGRHLADYYAAFGCLGTAFRSDTDVTPFVLAHIEAQLHQVRALDLRERIERQVWAGLEEVAAGSSLPDRVAHALWDGFFAREITAGDYRSSADVSPATATNDLAGAVRAGLLHAEGRQRGRRYSATETLFERLGQLLVMDVSGPPEVSRDRIVSELSRRITENERTYDIDRPSQRLLPEIADWGPDEDWSAWTDETR